MKRNPKESDFKTVTIKKEALDSAMRKTKSTLNLVKNVTPDKKKKGKTPNNVKAKSQSTDMEIEPMNKLPKTKSCSETININSGNVLQYLLDTPSSNLTKLNVKHMHEVIQAWKEYRGIAKIQDIQSVSEAFLLIEMEDIKHAATQEQDMNRLTKHLKDLKENKVDEELEQAKHVHLTTASTIEDVQQYDKDELVYYLFHHCKEPIDIHKTMGLDQLVVADMVFQYLSKQSQHQDKSHEKPSTAATGKVSGKMMDSTNNGQSEQASTSTKLASSLRTSKRDRKMMDESQIAITSELTDTEINSADIKQLQQAFHQFSIQSGEVIPANVIEEWTKEFITEVCITKRNNLLMQKRMMKQMKTTGNNDQPAKTTMKKTAKMKQTSIINPKCTKNTCRYSLHFTIPANYKGTDGLREFLSMLFMEMIKYGEDLCIYPWSTDALINPISDANALPTTITSLSKYFEGARSPESSIQMYLKIRLGYALNMKKDNFDADVQGWCKAQSIRMYQCSVQHPNVKSCGWLVYAPRTLNQQKWCQKVTQIYEAKYDTKNREPFQIGLTWRALNGQWEVDKKNKVRAMHIEAPVEIAPRVKNFLRILSQNKKWPLNVRFRVMDEFSKYMRESTKQKYRYMVSKHVSLLDQLGLCECTQILNLDKRIGSTQSTLRDVILNIRDKKDGYRVFGSIDEKWNSDTIFVATYRPDKSTLAYDFVRSLSTYVTHLFPDTSFKRILTAHAIDKAKDETYNPTSQSFVTQDDIDLDREIQADLDDDSMNFAAPDDLNDPFQFDDSIRLVGGDSVWDLNGDDDTVSTNQPNGLGNVSFDSAVCRLYDTNSCASSVNSASSQVKQTPSMQINIVNEINKLAAPLPHAIQEDDSKDGDAEAK